MFFLSLDHQLLLVLVLIFSSILFFSAFLIRMQSIGLRAFEFAFALPLFLAVISFLTATYRAEGARDLLALGHLFLVMIATSALFLKKNSDAGKLFFVLPFVFILAALLIVSFPMNIIWYSFIHVAALLLVVVNLFLSARSLFYRNKQNLWAYLGLLFIASALFIWLLTGLMSVEALILLTAGYTACVVFVYKSTLYVFFTEYKKNMESMQRINASIQSEVNRRVEEIERSNRKLLELSKTDSLTGLYGKNAILKNLESHLERSPQTAISVLMLDIDHFKQINDTLGHQVGDRCIKSLSTLIKASFRRDDILGRYGGDEFMILLPAITSVKAYLIADRFKQQVQSKSVPQFTVSIGIASYPDDAKTARELIEAADKALYTSKQKGRNMVTLYSTLKTN